ncbi:hypothetical protein BT69DRAFT_1117107 [Atractiella rhizophila]|nr:hypothetical protein BT69DRAFT_1117107 [Atractiella rhizophila]
MSNHSEILGSSARRTIPVELQDEEDDYREQGKARKAAANYLHEHCLALALAPSSPLRQPNETNLALLLELLGFFKNSSGVTREAFDLVVEHFNNLWTAAEQKEKDRLRCFYLEHIIMADNLINSIRGTLPSLTNEHYRKYYPECNSKMDYRLFINGFWFYEVHLGCNENDEEFWDVSWAAQEATTRTFCYARHSLPDLDREGAEEVCQRLYQLVTMFHRWRASQFHFNFTHDPKVRMFSVFVTSMNAVQPVWPSHEKSPRL